MDKQIVLGSTTLSVPDFGGAMKDGRLVGARQFIAAACGVTLPATEKGKKGPTMKEVKALILKVPGQTDATIKAASKAYDAQRSDFYRQSGLINGQLAADPTLRKSVRLSISKKSGEVIGAVTTYRKEAGGSALKDAAGTIARLEAKVKALEAAALPAPASA